MPSYLYSSKPSQIDIYGNQQEDNNSSDSSYSSSSSEDEEDTAAKSSRTLEIGGGTYVPPQLRGKLSSVAQSLDSSLSAVCEA